LSQQARLDAYVSPDSDAKISDLPQIKLAEPGAREVDRWQEKGGKAKREGIIRSRRLSGPPWGMPMLSLMLMHAKASPLKMRRFLKACKNSML
jgi:hypothetical protein